MNTSQAPLLRGLRGVYIFLCWLFAAGVVLQFFFAGLGVLVDPSYFSWHTFLGFWLEPLLVMMLTSGGWAAWVGAGGA